MHHYNLLRQICSTSVWFLYSFLLNLFNILGLVKVDREPASMTQKKQCHRQRHFFY